MNNTITTQAQLWTGNPEHLEKQVVAHLQRQLCAHGGCAACTTCRQFTAKQHYRLLWIAPEKSYTLEELEPLFETIAFARDQKDPFFFVLSHVELLNSACANQLLKVLEEPPIGYHFILLTHRINTVIPTIRSRCMVIDHGTTTTATKHPLFEFFIQDEPKDPLVFAQLIDSQPPNEHESLELVDNLLAYYYQKTLKNVTHTNQQKIELLQKSFMQPPMPGSSKLFWRNILINWPRA